MRKRDRSTGKMYRGFPEFDVFYRGALDAVNTGRRKGSEMDRIKMAVQEAIWRTGWYERKAWRLFAVVLDWCESEQGG